jgi:hypothetical protein
MVEVVVVLRRHTLQALDQTRNLYLVRLCYSIHDNYEYISDDALITSYTDTTSVLLLLMFLTK